jgi:hypoxanthine phosphoribosyltransferase
VQGLPRVEGRRVEGRSVGSLYLDERYERHSRSRVLIFVPPYSTITNPEWPRVALLCEQTVIDTCVMIPSNFKLQYSEQDIGSAVSRMGDEISNWAEVVWKESHTDLIAIPVLRGGIFFFADLVRKIRHSVEISPVQTWAYSSTENAVQRSEIRVSIDQVPSRGRSILLIDDICDSGRTLAALKEALLNAGAHDVRAAVLIRRVMEEQCFSPDWSGFEYRGHEWFVGYGMEDCGRWRNLPATYIIAQG